MGPLVEHSPELTALARAFGHEATACVGDAMRGDRAALTAASVEIITFLRQIWSHRDIAPEEIWTELDHRMQLGAFLAQLQQDARSLPRRGKATWHPASTKLP